MFFAVQVTAGKAYRLTVQASFDAALYVLTSCSNPAGTCVAGADAATGPGSLGGQETLTFIAATSGTYTIGIDSQYPSISPSSNGLFTLTVQEYSAPPNMTCAQPQALTFSGTKASVTADTSLSSNDLPGITCGGAEPFAGPQLYYEASLTAGKHYLASLQPGKGFDAVLYAFPAATSCSTYAINPACFYSYSAHASTGSVEEFLIAPTKSEDWTFVVDSKYTTSAGPFSLTLEDVPPPVNDTCAGAKPLVLPAGPSVVKDSGQTYSASDDVDLGYTGCTGQPTAGSDVFYKIQLTAPYTYELSLTATGFNGALYVLSSCASPSASCVAGADSNAYSTEYLTITPGVSQTYIIGVDGRASTDVGKYLLSVTRK